MSVDDEGLFASTDARYRGKGLAPKSGTKLKAKFNTPMSNNKSSKKVSIKCDSGDRKGEKENGQSDAGTVGGVVGDDSSDGQYEKEKITKEKLHVYCRHLGDGRGECYWCCCCCDNCCVGVKRCQICKGLCCTFVNDVVNALC